VNWVLEQTFHSGIWIMSEKMSKLLEVFILFLIRVLNCQLLSIYIKTVQITPLKLCFYTKRAYQNGKTIYIHAKWTKWHSLVCSTSCTFCVYISVGWISLWKSLIKSDLLLLITVFLLSLFVILLYIFVFNYIYI